MAAQRSAVQVTVERNPMVSWLADRSVIAKSLLAAGIATLLAVAIAVLAGSRMAALSDDISTMKELHVESLEQLGEIRSGVGNAYRGVMLHTIGVAYKMPPMMAQGREAVTDADAQVDGAVAAYREVAEGHTEREAALTSFADAQERYRVLRNTVVFQEAPPAGVTLPPLDEVEAAFAEAEADMNQAVADLATTEATQSDQMVAQTQEEYERAQQLILAALGVGLLLTVATSVQIARLVRRQLGATGAALAALAEGDLTSTAAVHSRDELGRMADAVNRAAAGIRTTVESLAAGARTLGDSSQQLTGVTGKIATSAQEAAAQANLVASAAGEVSANVQTVAAGSEEMGSSIREIAQNANDAAQVAAEAVGVAETTNQTVSKLGDSSAEIGNVVKVITSIAEQTNLLALNATIEAARAGEAGKGFAVVANEVKELAQETARATEDISRRVEAIQSDTSNAVAAIGEISAIIGRINDYQLTIASAVEEQTATTGEMSRSVGEAATGATDIAANITGVASATQATTASLADADRTVGELAALAGDLQAAVGRFRL